MGENIYQLLLAKQGSTTKETYTYELVGNRLSSLGLSPYSYNTSNELTALPGGSYTYDNNGNTKTKPDGTQYTWDFENRRTQVVLPGAGGTVNFKYDPFGRRIQKEFTQNGTTTTTNYVYDGANILETLDNKGNLLSRYTQGKGVDQPLAELISGTANYYEQDGLGSVTSLSNSSGVLAKTYAYDSYGKLTASTGAVANPFEYTGREFDAETGMYYNRARYCDQSVGRFFSGDPVRFRAGTNFYSYTRNRPVILTDAFGYQGCSAAQWAQSPNACAGGQDSNAPYQGPDGLWYNVPDPTPPLPNDGPTPPPNPPNPNNCDKGDQPPIPAPTNDGPACAIWSLADAWVCGFARGSAEFGLEEIAVPGMALEGTSFVAHWMVCGRSVVERE